MSTQSEMRGQHKIQKWPAFCHTNGVDKIKETPFNTTQRKKLVSPIFDLFEGSIYCCFHQVPSSKTYERWENWDKQKVENKVYPHKVRNSPSTAGVSTGYEVGNKISIQRNEETRNQI